MFPEDASSTAKGKYVAGMPHLLTGADKGREPQTQPPGSRFTFLPEQTFALRIRKKFVFRKLATFRDTPHCGCPTRRGRAL